jgi:uncharacterized peroxidase-related enzyme
MTEFITHTIKTAPEASRPLLQKTIKELDFIPNLYAVMAESLPTLEANLTLTRIFENTDFTDTERQLILLSISRYRNCCYCLAAHSTIAKMQKVPAQIVADVYYNQPLKDDKLEALREFTQAILSVQGWVGKQNLQDFYQAGYGPRQVLEIVLAISFKTLSNYINHINDTPIDTQFISGLPENNKNASTSVTTGD